MAISCSSHIEIAFLPATGSSHVGEEDLDLNRYRIRGTLDPTLRDYETMDRPFPAYKGDEPYVFVSYSHSNSSAVFPELTWLKERGFNIWYDEGIEAGTEWRDEIGKSIKNASLFLYFVSPESAQSKNCRKEVSFADKEHIRIIAIYLKATPLPEGLDLTLSDRQAILRYELPKPEYRQKLQLRISSYLDQPIIQPSVTKKTKKTVPLMTTVMIAVILIAAVSIGLFLYDRQVAQRTDVTDDPVSMYSVAVIPFANISNNKETGIFADGLSEDILDNLARTKRFNVPSRSDSFQFKDNNERSSIIGEQLKVAYLLEGSVRQQNGSLLISAQLTRTEDGFQVWSKPYQGTLSDGFESRTALALNIAHITATRLDLDIFRNHGWKQQGVFRGIDPRAVQHFLDAWDEYGTIRLGEGGDWNTYIQFLKDAIEVDPDFAHAYSILANAYLQLHGMGRMSLREARPAAHTAIGKAVALAPSDFNSLFQLSQINVRFDLQYDRAEIGYRQLLRQLPKYGFLHFLLADIAIREGRTSAALKQLANASEFNVVAAIGEEAFFRYVTAVVRSAARDYEGALQASTHGLRLAQGGQDRERLLWVHASSLIWLERVEEAEPFIKEGWSLGRTISPEKYISLFAYTGETEMAESIFSDARFDLVNSYYIALGHLALGDIDNTFTAINTGIENLNGWLLSSLLVAEWWDPVRDDPRFDEMLELLDSKVTHTEQYLRDHKIEQIER